MRIPFYISVLGTVSVVTVLAVSVVVAHPATLPVAAAHAHAVCGTNEPGTVRCHAWVVDDAATGKPFAGTAPSGFGPAQYLGAYGLTGQAGDMPILAIVDAYDYPNIQQDLDTYSDTFGISRLPACIGSITTSSVPCLQKVDQRGGTKYPRVDAGWAMEIALDVEVAHATCQNCRILLVEADTNAWANLLSAVDRARLMGAKVISNSYGAPEFSSENSFDSHFNYPGVAFTVSSGDGGYGVEYPAASQYVTAVGGTALRVNSNNTYRSESAWSGAGSGCSQYEPKPTWQTDTLCAHRTVADVAAAADPSIGGAAIYDSVKYHGVSGWMQIGGTSLAAPLIASVYAQGATLPTSTYASFLPYAQLGTPNLHDVVTGSNGTCGGSYLCAGLAGYDGPTGVGTPSGAGAF